MNRKQKKALGRILAAAALLLALGLTPLEGGLRFALYMIPYAIVGGDILRKAVKGAKNRQPFDENFLMAVATLGAILLGDYVEGVAVMLFYQIGELFQSYAVGKSRRSIGALMDIRPDYARVEREGGESEELDPDEVAIGSVIRVHPGERIPIDGVVIEGRSTLDTSALTGESVPREVKAGEDVISGCINQSGVLRIRTTKAYGESTVSRILDLVENASAKKSRPEQFITRFARIYTPAVCLGALALALLPPLGAWMLGGQARWGEWISRALTFLVISCPCALVVSIPLSFFAGIGCASREGVLVKGASDLEKLSRVDVIAFDKTGTVTQGVFEVVRVNAVGMEENALLELAALAESRSSHPISLSLQKAYAKAAAEGRTDEEAGLVRKYGLAAPVEGQRVGEVEEIGGCGVTARVDGRQVAVGSARLMARLGVQAQDVPCEGTLAHVAVDGRYAGYIVVADRIKPQAAQAIAALRSAGVKKTVMLTGDREESARSVAAQLGVDEVRAQLMPQNKVACVEALMAHSRGGVAFVGDGINDAPVLTRADVGVAMGALGSDAAIEAADVVLMDDDPRKIAKAIAISRKCLRIVYQNIAFAIGVKALCLLLGALGITGMWAAIFADVGVMVLAVLNAIRAMRI